MRKSFYKSCEVGRRDFQIFAALNRFKVMSLEQIWMAFFRKLEPEFWDFLFLSKRGRTDGGQSAAYQRLEKLVQFDYLECEHHWGFCRTYRLSWKGFRLLWEAGHRDFKRPPAPPRKGEMEHSLLLSALGLAISRHFQMKILSERELISGQRLQIRKGQPKHQRAPLPDMRVFYRGVDYRLELELSEKSAQNYRERWDSLGFFMRREEPGILYIAKGERLKQTILRVAERHYFYAVYVIELSEFKRLSADIWRRDGIPFANFKGREFLLSPHRAYDIEQPETKLPEQSDSPTEAAGLLEAHAKNENLSNQDDEDSEYPKSDDDDWDYDPPAAVPNTGKMEAIDG